MDLAGHTWPVNWMSHLETGK